jgi:hypothetical protein
VLLAAAADIFTPARIIFQNVMFLEDQKPIALGPFVITPFLVDHSAYDAYAILVEADGKRIFYSGDFRAHGRKRQLLERLIQHPPERVDVLLMEGTTISRVVRDFPYRSRPGRTVRRSLSPDHWNASRMVLGPEHRQAAGHHHVAVLLPGYVQASGQGEFATKTVSATRVPSGDTRGTA